jgi:hypothetical protein
VSHVLTDKVADADDQHLPKRLPWDGRAAGTDHAKNSVEPHEPEHNLIRAKRLESEYDEAELKRKIRESDRAQHRQADSA